MVEHREGNVPLFPQAAVVCSAVALLVVQAADLTLLHTGGGEPGGLSLCLVSVAEGSA